MVLWSAPAAQLRRVARRLERALGRAARVLLAVSLAGSILAHATRSSIVRAVFWSAAIVPLFGWIHQHAGSAWLMPGLVTVAAVYALTLLSQFVAVTGDDASGMTVAHRAAARQRAVHCVRHLSASRTPCGATLRRR